MGVLCMLLICNELEDYNEFYARNNSEKAIDSPLSSFPLITPPRLPAMDSDKLDDWEYLLMEIVRDCYTTQKEHVSAWAREFSLILGEGSELLSAWSLASPS